MPRSPFHGVLLCLCFSSFTARLLYSSLRPGAALDLKKGKTAFRDLS